MLYRTLLKLKERNGLTDDLKNKIDIFFATGRITEEQYNELMDINKEEEREGRKSIYFAPTEPLSTYLFSFVAGKLEKQEYKEGRRKRVKGEHRLSFLSTERRNYGKSNF